MKKILTKKPSGFTLMETVIAIGVLAVMLTAFMAVFGPATRGIRRSINVQEADRLTSALEKELATNRPGASAATEATTAFHKAHDWILKSHQNDNVIFAYQYRGNPNQLRRDGTMEPYTLRTGQAGRDYVVQPMFRRRVDALLAQDLTALQGRVFFIKMTQLVFDGANGLKLGTPGVIANPPQPAGSTPLTGTGADSYTEAVIPFTAEFFEIQTTDPSFLKTGGRFNIANYKKPMFTRNLAVRR
jgi:prepilin-type N-terminal cleavage/methylation domain-containing protein